ncbi:hypothetical protein HHK36_022181 [Tetracentron sinense]|uniref:Uncharacterized protein n=1 Tax=Tetracentron sinense TaxID=13715 RepID=A0A835D623_TETSI|nr:hypothetical protein HHK36_022181 [Tetracentron sinense]
MGLKYLHLDSKRPFSLPCHTHGTHADMSYKYRFFTQQSNFECSASIKAYLGEGAGGRAIIPRGNRQSGWVALLSALGVVDSSRSSKGKGGTMLSRPVMRYGQSVDPREEFVSLNEKERTSKKVELDQADGDFQPWAMAVVCSIAGPEGTDDWEEVAKIINKLIPEEEFVTLFPFEAHRAIYHTKKESHISSLSSS